MIYIHTEVHTFINFSNICITERWGVLTVDYLVWTFQSSGQRVMLKMGSEQKSKSCLDFTGVTFISDPKVLFCHHSSFDPVFGGRGLLYGPYQSQGV